MTGDLHCHSRCSDGSLGVEELVQCARRTGLDFLALTDHDTMLGVERAQQAGERYGVRVIGGVELSCWDSQRGRKVHLLCYLPQRPQLLKAAMERTLADRNRAMEQSLALVAGRYPISRELVNRFSQGSACLYNVHIMRALMELGYADRPYGTLFRQLLAPGGSCYVSHAYGEVWETARLIQKAGGVCVLAHPSVYDSIGLMEELAQAGLLDGVERFFPRLREQDIPAIDRVLSEYGLIPTGGTDFHGSNTNHPHPLGTCVTTQDSLERLFHRAKIKQREAQEF